MYNCKLSVISELTHLPSYVVLKVLGENLLSDHVAVWKLENLREQILLLLGNEKGNFRRLLKLLKDCGRVLREFNSCELLLLKFSLLHVYDLGEIVVILKGRVVENVRHLLFDRLVNLDLLLTSRVVKLRSREQFLGITIVLDNKETWILVVLLVGV